MREILFRGKREETLEWVEGDLLIDSCKDVSMREDHCTLYYDILPETVGQYTGLTDKNGNKIFEGDIVKEYLESLKEIGFNSGFDFGKVFWYSKDVQFLRTSKVYINDAAILSDSHKYEVIGNIHDNPELLRR